MMRTSFLLFLILITTGLFSPSFAQSGSNADLAVSQLLEGNFQLAKKTANDVINNDKNNGLAYAVHGAGEIFDNRMTAAQADLERAVKISPDNGVYNALLADCYWIQNNTATAKKTAEKALGLLRAPKTSLDYFARALAAMVLEKPDDALADYSKAIELNPRNVRAIAKRGLIYNNRKQLDLALADFNKAIELNPRFVVSLYYRGNIYLNQQKRELAIADYTKVVETDPTYADAWFNRAVAYKQLSKFDQALADYAKYLQLYPKDYDAYNNRGHVYYVQEKYDDAIVEYSKAIELAPKVSISYVFRGNCYGRKDQVEAAIREHTRAIEIDPKQIEAYIQRGHLLYRSKMLAEANKDYTKVVELDPKNPTGYLYLGFIHHDKQHFQEAITNYSKSIELDPKNMYAYQNRAEAYDAIGNSKLADLDRKQFADLGGQLNASGGTTRKSIFPLGSFDPALAKAALSRGLSTIRGKACTKVDGLIFNASGVKVVLYPVTPYLEEWYDLREKKEGKKTGVYMSNEANDYVIEAYADSEGRFEFRGLKPGKYFIQVIHSFNQLKTSRIYTGSDVSQNGPVRTTTNYYYDQDYTVARAKRLEKFVEIKEDGENKKITMANGLIKSCTF
ncbi:tetratricopeptide repeat protein [Paraflavitalea soli]|uniref:Tetratricopeptide repeat protein n=1 Tax=Paraflavitalea soli TaxID=2315862 RepID=A0A3B7MGQ3_9BACT|nr:tetratricopeptide repeat protein [Paraflavitalea soli]AXY73554.1 tetratricopeptide repeat protein [Paraflavitalea soli]